MAIIKTKLTPAELKALFAITTVAGNGGASRETLAYYLRDLYTWFDPTQVIEESHAHTPDAYRYTRHEIGGFMSSLEAKGMITKEGPRDWSINREGVEYMLQHFDEYHQTQIR